MRDESKAFWQNYRKISILAWVCLLATVILPVVVGTILHFLIGESIWVAFVANALGLGSFVLFFYYSWQFILARCPHCDQYAARLKNLLFPIDPICPKCGKRMDQSNGCAEQRA